MPQAAEARAARAQTLDDVPLRIGIADRDDQLVAVLGRVGIDVAEPFGAIREAGECGGIRVEKAGDPLADAGVRRIVGPIDQLARECAAAGDEQPWSQPRTL